jgi:hypothetical protein
MNPCTKQKKEDATVWNVPTKDEDTTIVSASYFFNIPRQSGIVSSGKL